MASTYKVLGQSNPSAATLTTLYTVPSATSAVASTLAICNQSTTTTVRVAVRPAGATLVTAHYIVYERYIDAGDTIFLTLGLTLATTDVVSVYATTSGVSFNLFGSEIT